MPEVRVQFTQEDYDYLLMFIDLSSIRDKYVIGELLYGVVEIKHMDENNIGFIYKTITGNMYTYYDKKRTYLGRMCSGI